MNEQLGGIAIVGGDSGLDLVTLPQGSSVFPTGYLQRQETLWQITQAVAEKEVVHADEDDPNYLVCPFCDTVTDDFIHEFPHEASCIVVKARALVERKVVISE